MKILIAGDHEPCRRAVCECLRQLGHELIEASDGQLAWETFLLQRPRAIVSDWGMPSLAGTEFCARVRQRHDFAYTYFILMSGRHTAPEDYQQAMEVGADDFLLKPVHPAELKNRVRVAERILGLTWRVQTLESFVPICSYCKRIRRGDGLYEPLESFVQKRSQTNFTHGICPECLDENRLSN